MEIASYGGRRLERYERFVTWYGKRIFVPGFVGACLLALVSTFVRRDEGREIIFQAAASSAGLLFAVWAALTGAGCLWLLPYAAARLRRSPNLWTGFGVIVSGLAGVVFLGLGLTLGRACGRQLWELVVTSSN